MTILFPKSSSDDGRSDRRHGHCGESVFFLKRHYYQCSRKRVFCAFVLHAPDVVRKDGFEFRTVATSEAGSTLATRPRRLRPAHTIRRRCLRGTKSTAVSQIARRRPSFWRVRHTISATTRRFVIVHCRSLGFDKRFSRQTTPGYRSTTRCSAGREKTKRRYYYYYYHHSRFIDIVALCLCGGHSIVQLKRNRVSIPPPPDNDRV